MICVLENSRADLYCCDALDLLRKLPDESVDALVTDPPAGIGFMGKAWDADKGGRDQWIAWLAAIMVEVRRVLKPGAHGLVWALPRTSHWTALALENAGFEIRDRVSHFFGTGFPKSLNVSKDIDRIQGNERTVIGPGINAAAKTRHAQKRKADGMYANGYLPAPSGPLLTAPGGEGSARWEGFGTALKPACEDWWLVRKPLAGTVARNVLEHGTGALNIDACRIGTSGETFHGPDTQGGRWPANVTFDESAAAVLDEQSGPSQSGKQTKPRGKRAAGFADVGAGKGDPVPNGPQYADKGGASRFFYVAKPSRAERDAGLAHLEAKTGGEATGRVDGSAGISPRAGAGRTGGAKNIHPTVKARALMSWLIKLICPPGGIVLDPFTGSGSTGVAAVGDGFRFIGSEQSEEYARIAAARIEHEIES